MIANFTYFGYFLAGFFAGVLACGAVLWLLYLKAYFEFDDRSQKMINGLTDEQKRELQLAANHIISRNDNCGVLMVSGIDPKDVPRLREIIAEELYSDSGEEC